MLPLLTSNPRKYEPMAGQLAALGITLRVPEFPMLEPQADNFSTVLAAKARVARQRLGEACLVDDSGLLLDAYPGFPGPMTRSVCMLLGAAGLERLLAGVTARGRMVCHLGAWLQGRLWSWTGEATGRLDPRRPLADGPGPLTQWFVPDEPGDHAVFLHRRRALEALAADRERLEQAIANDADNDSAGTHLSGGSVGNALRGVPGNEQRQAIPGQRNATEGVPYRGAATDPIPAAACHPGCVFCQEFDGHEASVYHGLLGRELPSRIVRRTPHFLAFPPLGQFVEGGLLLATREHRVSMAHLPDDWYEELERLIEETCEVLGRRYGCPPVLFEHAPASPGEKGTCCVDHAHLNVFPVRVDVHEHLKNFSHAPIRAMRELAGQPYRDRPYLFLQTNRGERFVYEAGIVPSQYVRRIVTAAIGMPERWHWREYLGLEELKRTFLALSGWRDRHEPRV